MRFKKRPPREQPIRLNHRIRVKEVRVIDSDGSQLGVMETKQALMRAQAQGLDLAEISPTAKPPVCKILDYGKFKYDQKKKQKAAKKKQTVVLTKEVQFRPATDEHDRDFKVKHITRFLGEGNKVRVFVRFRGREMSHADLGRKLLTQIIDLVGDMGNVESSPRMEGRIMSMIIAPNAKAKGQGKPKPAAEKKPAEAKEKPPEKAPEA